MISKPSIAIGSDHAGVEQKTAIVSALESAGFSVKDFGAFSSESVDYPDYAHLVARSITSGVYDLGILICGSGNGVCMAANKHQGIRAGLAWNREIGGLLRTHNNANVLCLGARFTPIEEMLAIIDAFLSASFEGGRHAVRVEKIPTSSIIV